ncbi:MAG TPA: ABC transporter permease [Firmicutes bacterium]|nr:ABC transporter permease [Bacillota bacterium]
MAFLKLLAGEIRAVAKQPMTVVILFVGPIFLTLLFGGVYVHNYLEDIPIAVLDEDNSATSRTIVRQFAENERFYVKYYADSREQLQNLIDSRRVYMGLYIPPDFSKDVNSLKSSQVLVLVDGTNVVIGNNSYAEAANIIQTLAAGAQMKILEANGVLPQTAQNMALAFNFNDRILYDPRLTYMNYLMLGFVAVFLQQVMVSSMGLSVVDDGPRLAGGNTFLGLVAKVLSCGLFAVPALFVSIGISHQLFRIPIRGNLWLILLMCVIFIFAVSCPAVIIASVLKDKLKVYQLSFMLSLPTFVSSGYVWPLEQTPHALTLLIKIFWPLIYFHRPFADVIFKGVPFDAVKGSIVGMAVYVLGWFPVAVWALKRSFGVPGTRERMEKGLGLP